MEIDLKAGSSYPSGRPTTTEIRQRRANLIKVATQLFTDKGFADTSFIDIARAAGMHTRTLRDHIGDKEAIFREVVHNSTSLIADKISGVDPAATLCATLNQAAELLEEIFSDPDLQDILRLIVGESNRFPDLAAEALTYAFACPRRVILEVFEDLMRRELIRDLDPGQLSEAFVDFIIGSFSFLNRIVRKGGEARPNATKERVAVFISGIA